ncbi:hypothetical protein KIN20_011752 [Parelaphostrongylus tenuis]|uniref:Uncharacterized protein n=1 Tax=Parelaphostrongylus tenuis TaxID=148309 RepID=A0AAD5MU42_PARTN|nr:hypothetical protein KIN20_011752 [Parelaphostrongylus tenuis]
MVFHIELQSMKSTKLKGKAHKQSADGRWFQRFSMPEILTLKSKPRSGRPTKKMTILTNKAGPSSAPFIILLLVSISAVYGCGVIPGGQTSTRTFTASGPSNLPIIAVYTESKVIPTTIPWYCNQQGCCSGTCTTFCNANSRRCSRNRRSESTLA